MIEVKNLSKSFGPKEAVKSISFGVEKGEVLGFLGPNGAGKSTTMRMITGYIPPSDGSISVAGIDMLENPVEAKKRIGYLPENAPLYSDLSVSGFLSFIASMRGLSGAAKRSAIDRAVELCFLESVRNQSVDTLSKGYRHRTCLAQSLLHDPDILILDEPTDGLDPNQKHEVRQLIKRMGEDKAIIFSTHILEEVEAACTRAMIISDGTVVANGTPDDLKSRASNAGAIRFHLQGRPAAEVQTALEGLSAVSRLDIDVKDNNQISGVAVPNKNQSGQASEQIFRYAADNKILLTELRQIEGRLDDVFRSITISDVSTAA